MEKSKLKSWNTDAFSGRVKHADEKKFFLRKALYELDRLSYDKGTRKGDYQIREKIKEVNDELEIYDGKIRTCDTSSMGGAFLYEDILLFFERNYIDNFVLWEKIELVKQEIKEQKEVDIEHNKKFAGTAYERSMNNIFRNELEKDIKTFEGSLNNRIIPVLLDFLLEINELLFIATVTANIQKWSHNDKFDDSDVNYSAFKKSITFFIRIYSKVKNIYLKKDEVISLVMSIFDNIAIKQVLLTKKNVDDARLEKIILESSRGYFLKSAVSETDYYQKTQDQSEEKYSEDDIARKTLKTVLGNLRYLNTSDDIPFEINSTLPENLINQRSIRYLYHSPDTRVYSLKDIADYLRDSLIFINEWLFIELKKNPDSYKMLKLLLDWLPEELKFYELFKTANEVAVKINNQKINLWGELRQFITKELAEDLINIIEEICGGLKDAFLRTMLDIEFDRSAKYKILGKKMDIIYNFFNDGQEKILKGLQDLN